MTDAELREIEDSYLITWNQTILCDISRLVAEVRRLNAEVKRLKADIQRGPERDEDQEGKPCSRH